jgi:hypothetical protein
VAGCNLRFCNQVSSTNTERVVKENLQKMYLIILIMLVLERTETFMWAFLNLSVDIKS